MFRFSENVAQEYEGRGKRVYRVPVGGSSALGAYAFWMAGTELAGQSGAPFDAIVHASSSGSTQVGLAARFAGSSTRVVGIAADPEPEIAEDFAALSRDLGELAGLDAIPTGHFDIRFDWVGAGYGIPSADGNDAIEYLARREGIFLDPIYSGKAFAGLRNLARSGELTGKVCFWHTGGVPALFSMNPR